jgi:hypothetical protein
MSNEASRQYGVNAPQSNIPNLYATAVRLSTNVVFCSAIVG